MQKNAVSQVGSGSVVSFNAIHSVIKSMFHKGQLPPMGPVRNGIFYFWIFFNETWEICRWAKHVPKLEISHCRKKLDFRKTKLSR
jgi:hypothetical protein